jgi:hypothetical protein
VREEWEPANRRAAAVSAESMNRKYLFVANRAAAVSLAAGVFAAGCATPNSQNPMVATFVAPVRQNEPSAMVVPPTTAPAGSDSSLFGINISKGLIGKKCRVQFRRDALGLSAPGLLEPTATSSAGKSTSLVGVVDQVSDVWLVIEVNRALYWIPVQQILMLEVE